MSNPNPGKTDVPAQGATLPLHEFLKTAVRLNASDVHLQAGSIPVIRVDGLLRFLDCPPLTDSQMEEYVRQICQDPEKQNILHHRGSIDLAYSMGLDQPRFRVSIFHSRERYAIAMRRIVTKIPNFDELNLPPQIEPLADFHRGLVAVSGTTGSGKSTTLAALIGKINRTRADRIITIEDPIEYQHDNAKSLVSQVEVGTDSESYEYALRAMMRQDPDTIQIGEIRDTVFADHGFAGRRYRAPGLSPPSTPPTPPLTVERTGFAVRSRTRKPCN